MINRRRFLQMAGWGTALLGLGKKSGAATSEEMAAQAADPGPRIRAFRELGKTGLRLSDVGFGAINLFNPNIFRYAYDCGVNHFDTAEGYLNTNSEKMLGQALKDVRSKVIVTTKHLLNNPADWKRESIRSRVEASLKRLQTDYLDIALAHAVDEPDKLDNPEILAAYTGLKKEGKARFIGFSTHDPALMLPKVLASDVWDVVLTVYNHMEGPAVEPLIAKVRAKGVGVIAMKVFAGGMQGSLKEMLSDKMNYSQAAIRWVLGNPSVDALIVTMSSFSHVDEYISASGSPLQRKDIKALTHYRDAAGPVYCRVSCRECLSACPYGVAVNEVLRYAMYFENYGMQKSAMQLFGAMDPARRPNACAACAAPCQKACPHGLAVRERLLHSQRLLTV
jgi:predicted aldo/keto reductase-like oxidoreductase